MTSAPSRPRHLWIINQYAVTAAMGGATRHHAMSKYLPDHGVTTTIIAGTPSRLDGDHAVHASFRGPTTDEGVTYFWIPTLAYATNGARRILSMLKFAADVLRLFLVRPERRGVRRPDAVLGSSPHLFAAAAGWLLSRRYRVPFILEVRDLWPKSLTKILGMSPRNPLVVVLGLLERFLYRNSEGIAGLLEGMPTHVSEVASGAVEPFWLPNGADLEDFPPAPPVPVHDDFVVAYAGAHGVPNALHIAVDAARTLASRTSANGGRYRFVFVGEGVEKRALQDRAAGLGVNNVEFLPRVSRAEVFPILAAADALLITALDTDLYEDGISLNKSFDYFAAGRPILMGLDTPYDPVRSSKSGISFAPEDVDALVEAVTTLDHLSLEARQRMGHNGREHVERNHRYSVLAARLADVVGDLTAKTGASRGRANA